MFLEMKRFQIKNLKIVLNKNMKTQPTNLFKNKPNELISKKNIGDKKFFNSRSVALVASILFYNEDMQEYFVLLGKRGSDTPDLNQRGKWNMPCGYLDWNETAVEGIKREVWEETGLDLDIIMSNSAYKVIYDKDFVNETPWKVQTQPNYSRQNVSLYFGFEFSGRFFPHLTNENAEPGEVEDVTWIPLSELIELENEIAFNHYFRINEFTEHTKNN